MHAPVVSGSTRIGAKEYVHFGSIALGSASERRYMDDLSERLGLLETDSRRSINARCDDLVRGLEGLVRALVHGG